MIVEETVPSKTTKDFATTFSTTTLELQGPRTTPAPGTAWDTSKPRTTTFDAEASSSGPVSSTFAFGAVSNVTVPPREPVICWPGYSPPATETTSPARATAKARASVRHGRAVVHSRSSDPAAETASRGATAEYAGAVPSGWLADATPATPATTSA